MPPIVYIGEMHSLEVKFVINNQVLYDQDYRYNPSVMEGRKDYYQSYTSPGISGSLINAYCILVYHGQMYIYGAAYKTYTWEVRVDVVVGAV